MTKTGVGIDADTTPASLDIGYLRHEGVLARVYDDDGTSEGTDRPLVHPVLTTVATDAGLSLEMSHSFATGAAALVFADALSDPNAYDLGGLHRVPQPSLDGALVVRKGGGTPYFFGTDTSVGLGVTWAGGNVPKSLSIGYKRKELAIVPLDNQESWYFWKWNRMFSAEEIESLQKEGRHLDPEQPGSITANRAGTALSIQELKDKGYLVAYERSKIPSLIATAVVGVSAESQDSASVNVGQAFATGAAATLLSKHGAVRSVLGPSLVPDFDKIVKLQGLSGNADLDFLQANSALLELNFRGAEAARLKQGLRDLVDEFNGGLVKFTPYGNFTAPAAGTSARLEARQAKVSVADFTELLGYIDDLRDSVSELRKADSALLAAKAKGPNASGAFEFEFKPWGGVNAALTSAAKIDELRAELVAQQKLLESVQRSVATDVRLLEALRYVSRQMIGGN